MPKKEPTRFVTRHEMKVERYPWGPHEWLSRRDLVDAEELLLVRIHMPRGEHTPFHRHPTMEEIIYVLHGTAEQWVDEEVRLLGPGDVAHIPKDAVHATFNAGRGVLRLLSVLGPAKAKGPMLVDVGHEEPWVSVRSLGRATVAKKRTVLRNAKKAQTKRRTVTAQPAALSTQKSAAKKVRPGAGAPASSAKARPTHRKRAD